MSRKGQPSKRKGIPNKWSKLYGSKRKIREVLTGEVLPPLASGEPVADDLLDGAAEISAYSGLSPSTVYNNAPALGFRRLKTPEAT
jgi:hypothetical protein